MDGGEVTRILADIEHGDDRAADKLLRLVYEELRRLADRKVAKEAPGQTLQATALVHEAYVRLVGAEKEGRWRSRAHFFAAAAEAMRRILIDRARRKKTVKAGGDRRRVDLDDLDDLEVAIDPPCEDLLDLDEALSKFAESHPSKAELVKLRYFAGLTQQQAAEVLGVSRKTADQWRAFARAWLHREMTGGAEKSRE